MLPQLNVTSSEIVGSFLLDWISFNIQVEDSKLGHNKSCVTVSVSPKYSENWNETDGLRILIYISKTFQSLSKLSVNVYLIFRK